MRSARKKGNGYQSICALLTTRMMQEFGSALRQATEGDMPVHVMTDSDQTWCGKRTSVLDPTPDWTWISESWLCEDCWQKILHWFYHARLCQQCGRVLPNENARFCSRTCYQDWRWQGRHGKSQSEGRAHDSLRHCERCDKRLTSPGQARFCSRRCYLADLSGLPLEMDRRCPAAGKATA